jgi:MFS family permease
MTDLSHRTVPGPFVTIAVLMLSAMTVMANATIAPALPALRAHYGAVPGIETLVGLLMTLPSLAIMLTAGLAGWLADTLDRQKLLIGSVILYAIGGTSGLWVDSLGGMLAGRVVLGIGVAGTMVLSTTWAADLWQGEARARFLGYQGAAIAVGGVLVILMGGALASLHWRGAFATYLLVVPVTLAAWLALAPFMLMRTRREHAGKIPPVPGEPFPWPAFAFVGTLGFLFMTAFYVIPTRLPFLLGNVGMTAPILLGAVTAIVTLAALPGALTFGRLRGRVSAMWIFALSWGVMSLGMLILSVASTVTAMAFGAAVVGLGMGPAIPNYTAHLMATVPPSARGRASGLLTTAFFAGQFVSPIVSAASISAFGLAGTFQAFALFQAALALVLAGMAIRMSRRAER